MSRSALPVLMKATDDGALIPCGPFHADRAMKQFKPGHRYPMLPMEGRSDKSHNHQFAWLKEAWQSLPEQYASEPWAQSPEHLRKFALIRKGFCDTMTVAVGSNAAAIRTAAAMRRLDEYAVVSVEGSTVHVFTPQSQSRRAMGKERFQASKDAILDYIAGLIGVTPETLQRQREAA